MGPRVGGASQEKGGRLGWSEPCFGAALSFPPPGTHFLPPKPPPTLHALLPPCLGDTSTGKPLRVPTCRWPVPACSWGAGEGGSEGGARLPQSDPRPAPLCSTPGPSAAGTLRLASSASTQRCPRPPMRPSGRPFLARRPIPCGSPRAWCPEAVPGPASRTPARPLPFPATKAPEEKQKVKKHREHRCLWTEGGSQVQQLRLRPTPAPSVLLARAPLYSQ